MQLISYYQSRRTYYMYDFCFDICKIYFTTPSCWKYFSNDVFDYVNVNWIRVWAEMSIVIILRIIEKFREAILHNYDDVMKKNRIGD